jgi:hypothetical protein
LPPGSVFPQTCQFSAALADFGQNCRFGVNFGQYWPALANLGQQELFWLKTFENWGKRQKAGEILPSGAKKAEATPGMRKKVRRCPKHNDTLAFAKVAHDSSATARKTPTPTGSAVATHQITNCSAECRWLEGRTF